MLSSSVRLGTEVPFLGSWQEIAEPFELASFADAFTAVLPAGQKIELTSCGFARAAKFNILPKTQPPKKITSTAMNTRHTRFCQFFIVILLAKNI